VLQDYVSYLDLCHAMHEETPDPSGRKEQRCFLSWQISTNMHLSASAKIVPIVLWAEGIFFGFFSWAMLCYVLCLVVVLPDQSDETNLRPPARYCEEICRPLQHTVAGTVREHCFAEDCSTAASDEPSGHIFNGIPPSRGPHAASFQFLLPFA
jgi:hypothetical protein